MLCAFFSSISSLFLRRRKKNSYAPRCFVCNRSRLEKCSAGQGLTTVQREHGGWLRMVAVLDDTTDWLPRAVRVCDGCWCDWMRGEPRFHTMSDLLRHLHTSTSVSSVVVRRSGYASNFRRERRIRALPSILTRGTDSWPSDKVADAIARGLGRQTPTAPSHTHLEHAPFADAAKKKAPAKRSAVRKRLLESARLLRAGGRKEEPAVGMSALRAPEL